MYAAIASSFLAVQENRMLIALVYHNYLFVSLWAVEHPAMPPGTVTTKKNVSGIPGQHPRMFGGQRLTRRQFQVSDSSLTVTDHFVLHTLQVFVDR